MRPQCLFYLPGLSALVLSLGVACAGRSMLPVDASHAGSAPISREAASEEAPVRILEDLDSYVFDDKGGYVHTSIVRYRVLTQQGVEGWSSSGAQWSPWYQRRPTVEAVVTDPDGGKHMLDPGTLAVSAAYPDAPDLYSDARVLRAPLPAISVGSVVEDKVVRATTRPFFEGGSVHSVLVQSGIPRDRVEVTVDLPESLPFRYELRDAKLTVEDTKKAGRRRVVFRGRDLAALKAPESDLPSDVPYWPYLTFGTAASWNQVARAYAKAVQGPLDPGAVRDTARSLVADGDDTRTKANKLLAWVHARVRYAGVEFGESAILPAAPRDTIKRAYGDCKDQSTLLVALLNAVDVPAKLALLSTGPGEDVRPSLPSLNVFNHAIVFIPGKDPLWLDPTSPFARAGELPENDQDRLALIVDESAEGLARTPVLTAQDNTYTEQREVRLADVGASTVVETCNGAGAMEQRLRASFDQTKDESRKALEKYVDSEYLAKSLGAVEVTPARDLTTPFQLRLEAQKADIGSTGILDATIRIDDRALFSWLPKSVHAKEERKSELVARLPYRANLVYRVVPPEGFVAGPMPHVRPIDFGPAKLERTYQVDKDGAVVARLAFEFAKRRLSASEVEKIKQGLQEFGAEPFVFVTLQHRGQQLIEAKRTREGLAEFRRSCDAHPGAPVHRVRMAFGLSSAGLNEAAREMAKKAAHDAPDDAMVHRSLGILLSQDDLGRQYGAGFDRAGALAAFRKAAARDRDDTYSRLQTAILLEYDDRGGRYNDVAGLEEAIKEYDAIDPKKLEEYDDGSYVAFPLFALAYAGKHAEVLKRAKRLGPSKVPGSVWIASAVANGGIMAGVSEAQVLQLKGEEKAQAFAGAAEILFRLRKYPEAATLMETASQTAADAVQYDSRARLMRRTHRVDPAGLPSSTPEQLTIKALAVLSAVDEVDAATRARLFSSRTKPDKEPMRVEADLHGLRTAFRNAPDSTSELLVDIWGSTLAATKEGDDATGYRVRVTSTTQARPTTMQIFVVKEGGGYRVRAGAANTSELGEEALYLIKQGNRTAAGKWLDWASELSVAPAGDDPLRGFPHMDLWKDKKDPKTAAAALCAQGSCATEALPILQEALRNEKDKARRGAILKAITIAHMTTKDYAKMLSSAELLRKDFPTSDAARWYQNRALWSLERYRDYRDAVNDWLRAKPERKHLLTAVAEAEERLGRFDAAVSALQKLIDEGMAEGRTYNERAWVALFRDRLTDEDLGHALRAVQESRFSNAAHLHTLATVYADLDRPEEAMQTLFKVVEARKGTGFVGVDWYVVGRVAEAYGLSDVAADAYGRVEAPKKNYPVSTYNLAQRRIKGLRGAKTDQ